MSDNGSHPGARGVQHRQVAVFHQPEPVTYHFNDSEVAAWYTDIEVPPGDYPLMGGVEHGRVDRCTAGLAGVIVDEYHAALWGGVPVGSGPYVPRGLGQPAVYPLTMDGYGLAGLLAEHGGRTKDGWFELTDSALEIRSREMLTARWLAHTWSYCQTCGDYMGPMPARSRHAAYSDQQAVAEQARRDQERQLSRAAKAREAFIIANLLERPVKVHASDRQLLGDLVLVASERQETEAAKLTCRLLGLEPVIERDDREGARASKNYREAVRRRALWLSQAEFRARWIYSPWSPMVLRYLDQLVEAGYVLSPVEQQRYDEARRAGAAAEHAASSEEPQAHS